MHSSKDWDVYQSSASGKLFYHHPTSGEVSWTPPQTYASPKRRPSGNGSGLPRLPRSANALTTFDQLDDDDGTAAVRDSIRQELFLRGQYGHFSFRRSQESLVDVPAGYSELYNRKTGLISYHDPYADVVWFTGQDKRGRLYFYTKEGRSEWALPPLKVRSGRVEHTR